MIIVGSGGQSPPDEDPLTDPLALTTTEETISEGQQQTEQQKPPQQQPIPSQQRKPSQQQKPFQQQQQQKPPQQQKRSQQQTQPKRQQENSGRHKNENKRKASSSSTVSLASVKPKQRRISNVSCSSSASFNNYLPPTPKPIFIASPESSEQLELCAEHSPPIDTNATDELIPKDLEPPKTPDIVPKHKRRCVRDVVVSDLSPDCESHALIPAPTACSTTNLVSQVNDRDIIVIKIMTS